MIYIILKYDKTRHSKGKSPAKMARSQLLSMLLPQTTLREDAQSVTRSRVFIYSADGLYTSMSG